MSLEDTLKRLDTDYIDIFFVHSLDGTVNVEELMSGLNNLINAGKVLYLGISDTPAWVVVKANSYAKANGLRPFSVYQGKWHAGLRDMEKEIIPMCEDQNMAIMPSAALGEGKIKSASARRADELEENIAGMFETDSERGSTRAPTRCEGDIVRASQLSENDIEISNRLEAVGKKKGTTLHAIVCFSHSVFPDS